MAPHPHVDAPLTDYILIEGRSFRKKIRLNNRETSKKNSSQSLRFGYYFYVYQEQVRDLFLHHVLFTILREFCRQILILLRELLNRFLRAIAFVLRNLLRLLFFIDHFIAVATDVADRHFALFAQIANHRPHFTAYFRGKGRNV